MQPPSLPRFLAEAYFCAPPAGTRTVGLVFADAATCARATDLPGDIGARLRARLAHRYRLPAVEIACFVYADLLDQLDREPEASAD